MNSYIENTYREDLFNSIKVFLMIPRVDNQFFDRSLTNGVVDCSIDFNLFENNKNKSLHGWDYSEIFQLNTNDYFIHKGEQYQVKGFHQNEIFQKEVIIEDDRGRLMSMPLKQDSEILRSIHSTKKAEQKVQSNMSKKNNL